MANRAAPNSAVRGFLFAIRHSLFAFVLLTSPLAAQTSQEVQRTAEQAIRRLDLQTELPRGAEPVRLSFKLPEEVLWLVIAIAVAFLLYAFRDLVPILRTRQGGAWDGDGAVPEAVA